MSKHEGEKVRKVVYFKYSKLQKGHYSYKNWRKLMTLKLDLKFINKWKPYTKFQLNMSKHVGENFGKLCISSFLSCKRGTPTKIDDTQTWSEVHKKIKAIYKISAQYVKACRRKLRISSFLSSKRGITPTKIDANWLHSNLICSTLKQSHMENFSSIC